MPSLLPLLVLAAGIAQLLLVLGSLALPRVLRWREETAKLRPLTRQVFWTYAGYIWATNLSFGLLSTLAPSWLLDASPLAGVVTAYMTIYWGARLVIQLTWFDRSDTPSGPMARLAEAILVGLFFFLTVVYAWATVVNVGGRAG
jgi:hypothetical protein